MVQTSDDILSLLVEKGAQVAKEAQRAVILQPGALGDCILTLPLAKLMKEALGLGGVDIVGHSEYIGILPGRSCVSSIRSIDSTDLHRLFVEPAKFDLADRDPLIDTFADYAWIVTFLGEPDGDFEQNLIFTANCSHSAEIITLSLKPPQESKQHVAEYYVQQFALQSGLPSDRLGLAADQILIEVTEGDRERGLELLEQAGIDVSKRLVVIQPGSGGRHKCWHLENFLSVARTLRDRGIEVLFLLGPAEVERFESMDKARLYVTAKCMAHLPLSQVVDLLSCADVVIGNDSGVTHLAAGMGLRTFALFGPTDPALYKPIGPALTVLQDTHDRFTTQPCPDLQKVIIEGIAPHAAP
ncbi:MAG: glycosyltransferase family 9 protein [Sedimentisphaerales bacterium]|mgnify:FL=1|jgi:ADP-heptose:LPS heptosyltransferase|nr:glycosyltransferase family 9 protein [Sedimentisphaerales bacterium]NLZ03891.1 glycosyltransferase family 9 protein [Phycisphaerae bacterium]HNY80463.1 glycosyltransferase family 9 protein [Sedimentisphaerales bacterium]HOC65304.1 glycosyltransferase family 9 protein [Sedimentisphaerales bacterium]HOH66228.1 glycosyltransferase family 9 protein [Sedimentisphaerales bacterium]